jgi:hypothetical protein
MRLSARPAVVLLKVNGVIFIWLACAESALKNIRPSDAAGVTGS